MLVALFSGLEEGSKLIRNVGFIRIIYWKKTGLAFYFSMRERSGQKCLKNVKKPLKSVLFLRWKFSEVLTIQNK